MYARLKGCAEDELLAANEQVLIDEWSYIF